MSRKRFQTIEVVERGYPVAHIMDTVAGREHWVRAHRDRFYHWDRCDAPVDHYLLRREARDALSVYRQEKERERNASRYRAKRAAA